MRVGDLVRMLPKNYGSPGHYVPDQWEGLVGIITADLTDEDNWHGKSYAVFIHHPDDSGPQEIFVSSKDMEVLNDCG